jgi:hypothetical protein
MAISKKELVLSLDRVNELLELRLPECVFYWRMSAARSVKVGDKAGSLHKDGYLQIGIDGKYFMAHRLVWFVTYGKFPDGVIDHIDGDPANNQIHNLRDVTHKVNHQNRKKRGRDDPSLPTGVWAAYSRNGSLTGYTAQWHDTQGKLCKVYHGKREWGSVEAALVAATAHRELEFTNLNPSGASYTDRHGVA